MDIFNVFEICCQIPNITEKVAAKIATKISRANGALDVKVTPGTGGVGKIRHSRLHGMIPIRHCGIEVSLAVNFRLVISRYRMILRGYGM